MKATTFSNNATPTSKSRTATGQRMVMLFALLTLLGLAGRAAFAQSASDLNGSGSVYFAPTGISKFDLAGTESHLSQFTCGGELQFAPGSRLDGALDGYGVAVFRASNGDQLVAVVNLKTDGAGNGQILFSWRHSIQLSDGRIVTNTGRFQGQLPVDVVKPVKTNIIAVLISLLIPAVKRG